MRLFLAMLTLALAAAVGTASASASTARTQATWGSKAHLICKKIDAEIDRLVPPQDLAGLATQLPRLLELGKKEYRQIAALTKPAGQRRQIDAFLATYPKLFRLIEQMIPLARAGKQDAFNALLARGNPISAEAKRLGTALRAGDCAD